MTSKRRKEEKKKRKKVNVGRDLSCLDEKFVTFLSTNIIKEFCQWI